MSKRGGIVTEQQLRQHERKKAAELLLKLEDAESSFLGFVKLMHPEWEIPPYQLEMIEILDKLEKRELVHPITGKPCYSVMINMPPRHNKSTLANQLFAGYCKARCPSEHTIVASYSADLAKDFGQGTRDYLERDHARLAFPNLDFDPSSRAKDSWNTTSGGRYNAVGIGGKTSGVPANTLIVDDPHKNRDEADSATSRNSVWNMWTSALAVRREPRSASGEPPITVVIMTRWHPDDLCGRIMELEEFKDEWMHVVYKGIHEQETDLQINRSDLPKEDPRYLTKDEIRATTPPQRYVKGTREAALWPERFPLEYLKKQRKLNERDFEALYQQSPFIQGGQLIKSNWWQYYDQPSSNLTSVVIGVDAAFKKTETADYTAVCIAGLDELGDIYILDVIRGKWDFPTLKRQLIQINNRWRGRGLRAMYIEDKASGQSAIQELKYQSGISVIPYKVSSDKVSRAQAVTPMIEGGRVLIPHDAPWLDDFLLETEQFPSGPHDDQVDAMVMALDSLARTPVHSVDALSAPIHLDHSLAQAIHSAPSDHRPGQDFRHGGNDPLGRSELWKSAWGE